VHNLVNSLVARHFALCTPTRPPTHHPPTPTHIHTRACLRVSMRSYTYTFTVSVHSHPNASSGIPPSVKQCGCDDWACVNRTSSSFGQMGANVTCWYDDADHSVAFSRPSRSRLVVGEIGMGFGVCFLAIGAMFAFLWLGNQASKRKQSAYQPIGGAIGNVNTASQYPQHSPHE
jgi:hypothetical protein